ncbi:MAG: Pseudouridine synthase, partial [Hyphomicrobiales bacterium]|nr:Pseudouridine synthase [Hyphomicrobiales bacterium]
MSDNSNHKAPRPRKAGASKGGPRGGARNSRPGASGGKSGAPKFGGAKSGGSKSAERPRSRSDAKPAGKSFGDKPFGDKPFRKAPGGERPMRRREEGAESAPRVYAPKEYSPKPPKGPPAKHFDKPRRVVRAEPLTAPSTFEGERIAKTMARVGLCSRRDAEAWIAEGRVAVNGEVLTTPAVNVTMQDRITVDGKPLAARERTRLFLFNKPRGLVTTDHDPEGRATIFDALPADLPRVVTIGRLDINTEGLLLLTNDGGLARVLELPSTGWLRRYRVRANGTTDQAQLDELRKGITIEGIDYAGIEANLDRVQGANVWLTMGLREGKNREIKRVLEHLGLAVNRLIRLSYGP